MDPYLGEIRMVAFNYAPQGWALCNGQLMSISQNTALFALLGTAYGGDGVNTFGLPDLCGRSPLGTGQGQGLSNVVLGEKGGSENITLLTSQMPAHVHGTPAQSAPTTVGGNVAMPASTEAASVASPSQAVPAASSSGGRPFPTYNSTPSPGVTMAPFEVSLQGSTSVPAGQTAAAGNGLPVPVRDPYLGMNFVIALQGVFPPRN